MGIVFFYLLCISLFDDSSGQQFGHHNMPGAGAGLNPRLHLPTIKPASQPGAVPELPSLPSGSTYMYKPTIEATNPPTTISPPREQPTTVLQHMPKTSIATTSVPSPSTIFQQPKSPGFEVSCTPGLCRNKGKCVYDKFKRPQCKCRHLYIGNFCEIVISPPKNISVTQLISGAIQISWEMPHTTKEIAGYVVQYNEFGEKGVTFSQIIHPSVTQFMLRDLEAGKQYTICISTVLYNVSLNKEAVLRDQCREINTKSLSISEKGISVPVMVTIIACVILLLFIIMTVALFVQRKCLKQKVIPVRGLRNGATGNSVNWERDIPSPRTNDSTLGDEYDTAKVRLPITHNIEAFRPIKPNTNPFLSPSPMHSFTNDGNINESHYGNLFQSNNSQVIMLTQQTCVSHGSSVPPDVADTSPSCSAAHIPQCTPSRRLQRIGSVPPANIRALPVTISNHVMRSANARDMDASGEFDLHRTYFFPKF